MILSRVAPIEQRLDSNTPCSSGPRWTSVAVALRIRSESGTQCLWVKPTIPHKCFTLNLLKQSAIQAGPRRDGILSACAMGPTKRAGTTFSVVGHKILNGIILLERKIN